MFKKTYSVNEVDLYVNKQANQPKGISMKQPETKKYEVTLTGTVTLLIIVCIFAAGFFLGATQC